MTDTDRRLASRAHRAEVSRLAWRMTHDAEHTGGALADAAAAARIIERHFRSVSGMPYMADLYRDVAILLERRAETLAA